MRGAAASLVLLAVATGCGESRAPAPERPAAAGRVAGGELRSPDTRSPFVPGGGLWRCDTGGRVEVAVSADGQATLGIGDRLLASVSPGRELVNRACDRSGSRALPPIRSPRVALGAGSTGCDAPPRVLVQFRAGDLIVRAAPRGRFLLGAAVSREHPGVARYAAPGCGSR
jgi:hypothetical protein